MARVGKNICQSQISLPIRVKHGRVIHRKVQKGSEYIPKVTFSTIYRVGQINPHKFQMVGNTHTKRNCNICFIQVIVYICISQDIVMFHQSMKNIEWSKRKETPSPNYAARVSVLPT